jgi:excisionase family DNA binding protein
MKIRTLEVAGLLTSKHVAALLGCHLETLYVWVKEGKITSVRRGRNVMFHPTHIEEYFARQSRYKVTRRCLCPRPSLR